MNIVNNQEKSSQKDEFLNSIFIDNNSQMPTGWVHLEENQIESSEPVFQGRLFERDLKQNQWISHHYELFSDKLIRIKNEKEFILPQHAESEKLISYSTNTHQTRQQSQFQLQQYSEKFEESKQTCKNLNKNSQSDQKDVCDSWISSKYERAEYLLINQMVLKRIQFSEEIKAQYKFGLRLANCKFNCQLFTDNQDYFNKWYEHIKRYCILTKFVKRYKILTKMKSNTYPSNSIFYYKCYNFLDYKQYSARIIDKITLTEQSKQIILKEIAILRKLEHNSILKLIEIFEDETNVFIITEMTQGKDLKSHLQVQKYFEEKALADIIYNLLQGLHHMHQKQIYHRDIKLENIMLRTPNIVSDICIVNFFMADFINSNQNQGKKCGTAGYIAPEIFLQKKYDAKVDVFSLGVIMYQMMYQRSPFDSNNYEEVLKLNELCNINFNVENENIKYTASCKDFLQKMLEKDPAKRLSSANLLTHSWFINQKNRADHKLHPFNNLPSLSTIIENELQSDHSPDLHYIFPVMTQDLKSNFEITELNEFPQESLENKMNDLNKQSVKGPSKARHENNSSNSQSLIKTIDYNEVNSQSNSKQICDHTINNNGSLTQNGHTQKNGKQDKN